MDFKEWFCLKERDSFTIDPKINPEDAKFYFGREMEKNRILKQLKRAFVEPGVPKMLIFGPYGSGKTQTLFFIDYILKTNKPETCKLLPYTVQLELEMRKKSDFRNWHLQIMEALGRDKVIKWLERLSAIGAGFEKELSEVFGNEANMVETAKKLLLGGEMSFLAWKWFCGYKLTSKELENLKVTRNLGDIGVGDTVNLLISLGRLSAKNNEKLIFLMDEAEQFRNVADADAMSDLHDYLRKLSDKSNSSTGFIISFQAVTLDDMPGWFHQEDILGRVGRDNIIDIPHLPAIRDVETFVKEMLDEFIDKEKADKRIKEGKLGVSLETYPFKADAFELLAEYATQDPEKALPRNIIRAINECAITAWDKEQPIIDTEIVNEIAPLIFG
ncbi:MAG TPA: hypothetical protein ENI35_01035 [Candidatus Desulfofervidus auxilii]|uniref:ATP-binding protein n=1 Tax=Desulfofervidus auxilii TaxID=1621989 RepID=A0A7C1ZRX9_DESA2|nr:hypothetical protein [Candidatus Desulfofervidus auxilii]